ncbi:MAG: biotin-dependent carboxyltransferase family protein [Pseudomonadota bacterium]
MNRVLTVTRAGPGVTVQDLGRPGYLAYGLSRGGAADRLALVEGAALLGQDPDLAVLELAGAGGVFEASEDMRIACTGAPMRGSLDGRPLAWNASHLLPAGVALTIGPAEAGVYGYLSVGGGIDTPPHLGSRSTHLVAGLGAPVEVGTQLPVGRDAGGPVGLQVAADSRFDGGTIRVVASLQTHLFDTAEIARFEAAVFHRGLRGNRMGVRMEPDGEGFGLSQGLTILSEAIVPGDIQITGDGAPYVLLAECGTTGGYPRLGSVIPNDLPRVAQAPPGAELRFRFIGLEEAVKIARAAAAEQASLHAKCTPLLRDPREMRDLLEYGLISGFTDGRAVES